jgi:hypothetical protein
VSLNSSIVKKYRISHTLFGGFGLFDPAALVPEYMDHPSLGSRLKISGPPDFEGAAEGTLSMLVRAVQVHERLHWLQFMGTTVGLFLNILHELHTSVTQQYCLETSDNFSEKSFPLLEKGPNSRHWSQRWKAIETLRVMLYGGAPVDVFKEGPGVVGVLNSSLDICKQVFESGAASNGGEQTVPDDWWIMPDVEITACGVVAEDGIASGAVHLMETGGRINEFMMMMTYLGQEHPKWEIPDDFFFRGIYGYSRDYFYKETGASLGTVPEMVLATLIDVALNPPLPPFAKGEIFKENFLIFLPSANFVRLVQAIKDFDFTAQIGNEYSANRELIERVYDHLKRADYHLLPNVIMNQFRTALSSAADIRFPGDIYSIEEVGVDGAGIRDNEFGRLKFLFKRSYTAAEIRSQFPELFVLPGAPALHRHKEYKQSFAKVSPPFEIIDGEIIDWQQNVPFWKEYFFSAAIRMNLMNWVAYLSYGEIIDHMKRLTSSHRDRELTLMLVSAVVRGIFNESYVGRKILEDINQF